jgi:hypothetical protein
MAEPSSRGEGIIVGGGVAALETLVDLEVRLEATDAAPLGG